MVVYKARLSCTRKSSSISKESEQNDHERKKFKDTYELNLQNREAALEHIPFSTKLSIQSHNRGSL